MKDCHHLNKLMKPAVLCIPHLKTTRVYVQCTCKYAQCKNRQCMYREPGKKDSDGALLVALLNCAVSQKPHPKRQTQSEHSHISWWGQHDFKDTLSHTYTTDFIQKQPDILHFFSPYFKLDIYLAGFTAKLFLFPRGDREK